MGRQFPGSHPPMGKISQVQGQMGEGKAAFALFVCCQTT
jgi:hypothetical protein